MGAAPHSARVQGWGWGGSSLPLLQIPSPPQALASAWPRDGMAKPPGCHRAPSTPRTLPTTPQPQRPGGTWWEGRGHVSHHLLGVSEPPTSPKARSGAWNRSPRLLLPPQSWCAGVSGHRDPARGQEPMCCCSPGPVHGPP